MKILVLVLFTLSLNTFAQELNLSYLKLKKTMVQKNKITGTLTGIMGMSFPKGVSALIYKYQNVSKSDFYSGDQLVTHPMYQDYIYKQQVHTIGIRYGISRRVELKVIGNVYKREQHFSTVAMRGTMSSASGSRPGSGRGRGRAGAVATNSIDQSASELGDTMVMAKVLLLAPRLNNSSFFLAVSGGVKLPTGKTNSTDERGNYLPWNIQTGSGSYDGVLELAASKRLGRFRFDGGLRSFLTTEGDRQFQKGNRHILTASATTRINRYIDTSLSTTYRIFSKNSLRGVEIDSTGGEYLYLAPSMAFKMSDRAQVSLGLSYMLAANTNGMTAVENYSFDSKLLFFF